MTAHGPVPATGLAHRSAGPRGSLPIRNGAAMALDASCTAQNACSADGRPTVGAHPRASRSAARSALDSHIPWTGLAAAGEFRWPPKAQVDATRAGLPDSCLSMLTRPNRAERRISDPLAWVRRPPVKYAQVSSCHGSERGRELTLACLLAAASRSASQGPSNDDSPHRHPTIAITQGRRGVPHRPIAPQSLPVTAVPSVPVGARRSPRSAR